MIERVARGRSSDADFDWQRGFDHEASAADIYYCFRLILGRSPTPPEWPGHASRAGEDLANLVPSLPVDLVVPEQRPINLVKVDVEGGEYLALLGLRKTLQRWHPTVVFEFSPSALESISGHDWTSVFSLLSDFGYRYGVVGAGGRGNTWTDDPQEILEHFERSGVDHGNDLMSSTRPSPDITHSSSRFQSAS